MGLVHEVCVMHMQGVSGLWDKGQRKSFQECALTLEWFHKVRDVSEINVQRAMVCKGVCTKKNFGWVLEEFALCE